MEPLLLTRTQQSEVNSAKLSFGAGKKIIRVSVIIKHSRYTSAICCFRSNYYSPGGSRFLNDVAVEGDGKPQEHHMIYSLRNQVVCQGGRGKCNMTKLLIVERETERTMTQAEKTLSQARAAQVSKRTASCASPLRPPTSEEAVQIAINYKRR